jgi:hypothetical protein
MYFLRGLTLGLAIGSAATACHCHTTCRSNVFDTVYILQNIGENCDYSVIHVPLIGWTNNRSYELVQ